MMQASVGDYKDREAFMVLKRKEWESAFAGGLELLSSRKLFELNQNLFSG